MNYSWNFHGETDLKILILSFYYYPDLCAGSFRCTALVDQLQQLTDATADIHVITTLPNRYSSYSMQAPEQEQQGNVCINRIRLPHHKSGMVDQAKAFFHFALSVKKLIRSKEYDLVFATSSRLMTASLGSWVARKKQAKLYLDIRDIFVDTINDILPAKLAFGCKPVFSLLEKWTFKKAEQINLVSKGFEPYFTARYPQKNLSWFSNGIDNEFVQINPALSSTEKPNSLTVLYAGNIGEGQGLHHIIPALAKTMKNLQFKIIGDGGRKQLLETRLQEEKCNNVQLLPPMARENLIQEYLAADILFLHLNDYGALKKVLPSKIFEYAAMGKPIWAGVDGYCAEFIRTEVDNAVVFEPCDAIAAQQVFKNLRIESQRRSTFIEKYSRATIMKKMAENILELAIV